MLVLAQPGAEQPAQPLATIRRGVEVAGAKAPPEALQRFALELPQPVAQAR